MGHTHSVGDMLVVRVVDGSMGRNIRSRSIRLAVPTGEHGFRINSGPRLRRCSRSPVRYRLVRVLPRMVRVAVMVLYRIRRLVILIAVHGL